MPAARRSEALKRPKPRKLNEGDTIEVSMTSEVKIGGLSNWIKVGVTGKVRAGETPEQADDRLSEFVIDSITSKTSDLLQG